MYNKKEITRLFEKYVETGDNKVFERLLEACDPMIDIVLMKYKKYSRHFDDVKQKVRLNIWKNKRSPENLSKYLTSPTTYLFFVVRRYVMVAFEAMKSIYKEGIEVTFSEYGTKILSLIQNEYLDPEDLYLFKYELPQKMFEREVKKLQKDKALSADSGAMQKAIGLIKRLDEEDFGVVCDEEE